MSSLRHRVLDSLRHDIVHRRIKSGDILLEKEVAARFEVSKTPVREALALLCEEGLVQLFPRRGYVVRTVSIRDAIETFDLRLILEGAAAERAARNLAEAQIDELAELQKHDCCGEVEPKVSDHLEAMRHSFDFHMLIARSSGNALLAEQIEKLLRSARRITSIGFVYGQHAGIVDALRSRDGAKARMMMEQHIVSGREAAIRALSGRDQDV